MTSSTRRGSLRTVGLGIMAAALGSAVAVDARRSQALCTITSRSSTNIASVPGFANALVDLAAVACGDAGAAAVPINNRVTEVASAMAEAVTEVMAECTGQGNAMISFSGMSRAEATAEAVGTASARVLASSDVCGFCSSGLDAFASAVETVAATAVAEASIMGEFTFQGDEEQMMTAQDAERIVEENIIDVLATVVGEVQSNTVNGCSGNANVRAQAGDSVAACDVAVSADDIITEVDAVAAAGTAVRALACEGSNSSLDVSSITREVATAVAQAVVQADSFCESTGGPGTMACGLSNGTVAAVARATASAFASGVVEAGGDGCTCDLSSVMDAEEIEEIIASASASALAQVCSDGAGVAVVSNFEIAAEELMLVAMAEFIGAAVVGADCSVIISSCADTSQCVASNRQCSGPGIENTLACCNPNQVCAALFGSDKFQCRSRAMVDVFPSAEVLECLQS